MEPGIGIHRNISLEEYLAWEPVGNSDLTNIMRSPAFCHWKRTHPEEDKQTPAKRLGSAIHCIILEPDEWHLRYCVDPQSPRGGYPQGWRNSKTYKELVCGISMELLPADDYDACLQVRDNVEESDFCQGALDQTDATEVSVIAWDDEKTLHRKIRPDALLSAAGMMIDVKTTRADTPHAFARDAYGLGYHRSAAFYLDTMNLQAGPDAFHSFDHYVFLTVANTPPYEVRPYTLDDESLSLGRMEYKSLLSFYAKCLKDNTWPGLGKWIEEIRLPGYAFHREEF